jgi:hypothetical protein
MKTCIQNLFIALGFFAGINQVSGQVSFALATNYLAGIHPYSIVAANISRNGKVDLICMNEGTTTTLVGLTNNGIGVFGSNATYYAESNPFSFAAADVSEDGLVDLICLNSANSLTVLTNNSSGSFVSASTEGAGTFPSSIVTADINGDGMKDLIVDDQNLNDLTILTNAGGGIFAVGSAPPPLSSGSSWFVAVADVNGDGKPDLIDVDSGYLRILTNNGDGVFTLSSTNVLATIWPGLGIAVDVNGDGKVDLVIPDYYSGTGDTLEVLTNNGNGIFSSNATYTVATGPNHVIAADVNGDGKVDLISSGFYGTLTVLTNNGNGGFGSNTTLNVASHVYSVVAADVNGDGKLDLITANGSASSLGVLINTSIFPSPTSTPTLNISASSGGMLISWPSASAGWSLQQNPDLATTNWSPCGYNGYDINDDGTNKSLIFPSPTGNLFFRLLHP